MIAVINNKIKELSNQQVESMYLDYFNNYLTIDKFAEHNQISWFSAKSIINKGKLINHNR